MRTIYKYPLDLVVEQTITGPIMEFLHLDWQEDTVCLWAEVDTDEAEETHHIYVVGTGHEVPQAAVDHIGTIQKNGFVWHVYTRAFWSDDERWVRLAPQEPTNIRGFRAGPVIVDELHSFVNELDHPSKP